MDGRAAAGTKLGRIGAAAAAICVAALAGLAAWGALMEPPPGPLGPAQAEVAARRAEAAAADAQKVWAARFAAELGREYRPARLRHFARAVEVPCAGGTLGAGPFYCASNRVLAMDLATLDALGARLRRDAETGVALFVGRVTASHTAAELGLDQGGVKERAEAADCLAGVWTFHAAARLGRPTAALYGRTLAAAQAALGASARGVAAADPALFARGAQDGREAAFARGLASGAIASCG